MTGSNVPNNPNIVKLEPSRGDMCQHIGKPLLVRDIDRTLPLVKNSKDIALLALLLVRRIEATRKGESNAVLRDRPL